MKTLTEKERSFFDILDEKQKRLYAGIEATRLGWHGVEIVSKQYGIHPITVRKGKKDIENEIWLASTRIRQVGGGRKKNH